MAPNFNHGKGIMGGRGFGGSCDYLVQSPDHQVPHPAACSSSGINIDGRRVGKKSSSKPKASKKKNGDHPPLQGERKQRLIWTPELHECFVEIYNSTPRSKLYPKKILEQMTVKYPFVTRENIASHLQKHRMNLVRNEENSAKASSKSVPLKIPKESNSQSIHPKTSNSKSTILLQSYPNSTNPISSQVLLQSHPNSTNPSFDCKTWVQNSKGCGFELKRDEQFYGCLNRFRNPQVHYQQQQPSFNNNNVDRGSYINSNMMNVCESQENPNWALPIGQSSIAPTNDLAVTTNLCPPPISTNQISGNDGNGIGVHPIMDFKSFGGWNSTNNDPFLGTDLLNFGFGDYYDTNLNFDNVGHDSLNNDKCYPGSYSEPLDFGYPLNFNTINGFQADSEQGLPSMYYTSVNPMENDFTSQQCFPSVNPMENGFTSQQCFPSVNPMENGFTSQQCFDTNPMENGFTSQQCFDTNPMENGFTSQQCFDTFDDNQRMEQQSNFTRKNEYFRKEYFPSKGSGI